MQFEHITYETDGKIVRIGLNRPKAVNAIHDPMKSELLQAFQALSREKKAMVAILFGHGGNFSSGVDLRSQEWEHSPEGWRGHFDALINIGRTMWNLDIPVIAAVQGYCLGGGTDLAVMADFVLADETARFGEPEIMMGSFAPTLIIPWLAPMKKAREFLVMGVELNAEEAKNMGLVNRVYPAEQFDAEVEKWAAHICNTPRHALYTSKRVINKQYEIMGFWEAIDYNREMNVNMKLHTSKEEREENLRFLREGGLKAKLKDSADKRLVR